MIWYDATEESSTNLSPVIFSGMIKTVGMEAFNGADYLIIPKAQDFNLSIETSLDDLMLFCENNKSEVVLVQRKTNSDFFNSVDKLPYIALKMLTYSDNCILFATGTLGERGNPASVKACQTSSLSWQLYYNGLYMHAEFLQEFFDTLRSIDNRDLAKTKHVFYRQPRKKYEIVGKSWAYILASLPGIGEVKAVQLSERFDNYVDCLNAILGGQTNLGKNAVLKIKNELGL